MARTKVDNELNVVIGTKAQIERDTSIPENSIVVVTDEELKADEIVYSAEKNVKEAIEDLEVAVGNLEDSGVDIVDNLTTNDATKVLSAKQGKALEDNKEALINKATNFSVVNDIKYPTTKAVKDLVDATVGDIDAILNSILGV